MTASFSSKITFKSFLNEDVRNAVNQTASSFLDAPFDSLKIVSDDADKIVELSKILTEKNIKSAKGNWVVRHLAYRSGEYVQVISPDRESTVYQKA